MKVLKNLKTHLVDCTALAAVSNPFFSAAETIVAGMSLETSLCARVIGTTLTYAGLGSIYTRGMYGSRRLFNIDEDHNSHLEKIHDSLYSLAFTLGSSPIFYYLSGSRNFKEIAVGTALSAAVALTSGGLVGYTTDAFRDLCGIKESKRLPGLIKQQGPRMKKGILVASIAASFTISSLIYGASEYLRNLDDSSSHASSIQKYQEKDFSYLK